MTQLIRLASGVDRSPAQRGFTLRSSARRRRAKLPPTDQDLARVTRANLLVVGAEDEVGKLIASLWPSFLSPIVVRDRGEPLRLPPASPPVGTIVICDVDTLTREEQQALNEWLRGRESGRAQIVSSASKSLLPLVETGAFNDELYYLLNVVTIDLTSPLGR